MAEFFSQNIGTVIVLLILLAIVAAIIAGLAKDRKQGRTSCGCGCKGCPNSGMCHGKK
jgi:hypothetical protein